MTERDSLRCPAPLSLSGHSSGAAISHCPNVCRKESNWCEAKYSETTSFSLAYKIEWNYNKNAGIYLKLENGLFAVAEPTAVLHQLIIWGFGYIIVEK